MSNVTLLNNFLTSARGFTFLDGGGITWSFDKATNELSASVAVGAPTTGTFTPTVVGSTTAGAGTYSAQHGSYTLVGNRCLFNLRVVWTATTGTGNLRIGGLPFTSNAGSSAFNVLPVYYNNGAAVDSVLATIDPGVAYATVRTFTNGVGANVLALAATGDVMIAGSYLLP